MIDHEIAGTILEGEGGDQAPAIVGAIASLPDLSTEHYEQIDAQGALELFERFPWCEHQREAATRAGMHLDSIDPGITFSTDSSFIWFMATGVECSFAVEISLPGLKKTLGVFRFSKSYTIPRAERADVPEFIGAFFDPSDDRRRSRIEALAGKYGV